MNGGIIYGYKVNGKSGNFNWQIRVLRRTFNKNRLNFQDFRFYQALNKFNLWYFEDGQFATITCDKIIKHST